MKTAFLTLLTVLSIGLGQSHAMEAAPLMIVKVLERIDLYTNERIGAGLIYTDMEEEKIIKEWSELHKNGKLIRRLTFPTPLCVCESPDLAKTLLMPGYDVVDPSIPLTLWCTVSTSLWDHPTSWFSPIVTQYQTDFSLEPYFFSILNNELCLELKFNADDNTMSLRNNVIM